MPDNKGWNWNPTESMWSRLSRPYEAEPELYADTPLGPMGSVGAMVVHPRTIGKFHKAFMEAAPKVAKDFPGLSARVTDALAFIQTRYPSYYNRLKSIGTQIEDKVTPSAERFYGLKEQGLTDKIFGPVERGFYKANNIFVQPDSWLEMLRGRLSDPLKNAVNTVAHEARHAMQDPTIGKTATRLTMKRVPYNIARDELRTLKGNRATGQLSHDEYMKLYKANAIEAPAFRAGDLAAQSFDTYKDLGKLMGIF